MRLHYDIQFFHVYVSDVVFRRVRMDMWVSGIMLLTGQAGALDLQALRCVFLVSESASPRLRVRFSQVARSHLLRMLPRSTGNDDDYRGYGDDGHGDDGYGDDGNQVCAL
jgi:hypothetical protein